MTRLPALLALGLFVAMPAAADDFTDTLDSALKAYREGDVEGATQDLGYATKLLAAMKSQSLAKFLPDALPGWTREAEEADEGAGFMGMIGGGTTTAATYTKGAEDVTITLVANSPMVSGIASMISSLAGVATGSTRPLRIQCTEFQADGDSLQGVVGNKVLVSVEGSAPVEDKTAYLEAMDFKALADF